VRKENTLLNTLVPFAVIGSTDFFTREDGRSVRARRYPWGIVEVENEEHCDFVKLREALLRINVEDLRERTHRVLYESYRKQRLIDMGIKDGEAGPGFVQAVDERLRTHKDEMSRKEKEMTDNFVNRVHEKEKELKNQEEEMKIDFAKKKRELDDQLANMERDIQKADQEYEMLEQRRAQGGKGGKKK